MLADDADCAVFDGALGVRVSVGMLAGQGKKQRAGRRLATIVYQGGDVERAERRKRWQAISEAHRGDLPLTPLVIH